MIKFITRASDTDWEVFEEYGDFNLFRTQFEVGYL